jgi:hypothetical protein
MKWSMLPVDKQAVARIEQVIKSEAYSLLRSEHRLHNREARLTGDPTSSAGGPSPSQSDYELGLLRVALAAACEDGRLVITVVDIEVLELLFAGHNLTSTARLTGLSIYEVKKSRDRWRQAYALATGDERVEESPRHTLSA